MLKDFTKSIRSLKILFTVKCIRNRLVAGFYPDLLGGLSTPKPPSHTEVEMRFPGG